MSANSPVVVDDDSPLTDIDGLHCDKPVSLYNRSRKLFVSPPRLSSEKKLLYKPLNSSFEKDVEGCVGEIIGEYNEGNNLFYFVRYDGGIARKFLASKFARGYGNSVEVYEQKKLEGSLAPFDPSATYVHPLDRVKLKIRISGDYLTQSSRSLHSDSPTSDESEDSNDDYRTTRTQLRSKRSTRVRSSGPPFSPQKTRSRQIWADSGSDGSLSDGDSGGRPLRRSARSRNMTKINLYSGNDDLDEDADFPIKRMRSITKKKISRPRSVMPGYGRVRGIETIEEDPFDGDDEMQILRLHRRLCEKCHEGPTNGLLAILDKKVKRNGKKRMRSTDDEFEYSDEERRVRNLGGWVQCLKCPVSAHWGCLANTQRDEILKNIRTKIVENSRAQGVENPVPDNCPSLEVDQMTEFLCGCCSRGSFCMVCMETVIQAESLMKESSSINEEFEIVRELFFRCLICKRLAHYDHLPRPPGIEDASAAEIAQHYQNSKKWLCADCSSFRYDLDKIIAWRPYPPNATETRGPDEVPNYKQPLPREYLVKWNARSYRRLDWVPHMWLASIKPHKLKNFIQSGTKIELLEEPVKDNQVHVGIGTSMPTFEAVDVSRGSSIKPETTTRSSIDPMPDAEQRIPLSWKTVHRVLDVIFWRPNVRKMASNRVNTHTILSSTEEEEEDHLYKQTVSQRGEQPSESRTMGVEKWEKRKSVDVTDMKNVAWAFIKWEELGYEEACWDAPPRKDEIGYEAFKAAFKKYVESRQVFITRGNKKTFEISDSRAQGQYRKYALKKPDDLKLGQPELIKLMPFQVDGFNWLCNNWWNKQHCILADEMGLGKTVQIVTFLGNIHARWAVSPSLVVVPNSTIMNWVREFERWAPNLRVVPLYGERAAREVIKKFELFHSSAPSGFLDIKFHVLVTTYDTITNSKGTNPIFKHPPRWEVLIIDEGQRLKNDSSLLFRKLSELNSAHRIIMTGTPLNNNIRELFNLMNFLDPREWDNLEAMEKQYQELDEDRIKDLHNKLRPYFLRRVKSEVLELPPKNEVIVPVSMTSLQREVYRSILSNNLNILQGLIQPSVKQNSTGRSRINNVLMELRKCLQHPYLYAEDIEPRGLSPSETHEKLIDASAKLRLLKILLSKLREGGHRVLLFSQFVIALNVIEDFLVGEKYKFLRLDGNTKSSVRQKSMDDFNKPGSDYFIFLLTTRAGGVGINLYTADTVIIFDPDFNPHQDLQAIARSYRYGQEKICLVFKLMVKDSAEERIIQIGKKKLVLDHLIVQKMDDDELNDGEDVKSILTYGAQALFNADEGSRDITYTEQDVNNLIEKTKKEAVQDKAGSSGLAFSFAKVWATNKEEMEEIGEEDQTDSWAQALQKLNEQKQVDVNQQLAKSGRGSRRKAADVAKTKMQNSSGSFYVPTNLQQKSASLSASEYSDAGQDSDVDDFSLEDGRSFTQNQPSVPTQGTVQQTSSDCGLCGRKHLGGDCVMVQRSENLAEYREMLIFHADDEPWEDRRAAVQAIDEILIKRSRILLIAGQPLHPLVKPVPVPPAKKIKKVRNEMLTKSASSEQRPKNLTSPLPLSQCLLCQITTPHQYKDCSAVTQGGSKRIIKAIEVLESRADNSLTNTINSLRTLLAKVKSAENSAGNAGTSM